MSAPTIAFHDYAGMVDAFRSIKDHLGLSNEALDELCNFTKGHTDKLLGPTGTRGFGPLTLNAMLWALAVKVEITVDTERAAEMVPVWEKRFAPNVRQHASVVSKVLVARAKPLVLKDLTHNATMARAMGVAPEKRSEIARHAATVRWEKHREHKRSAMEPAAAQSAPETCQAHSAKCEVQS